jgi:hypothetical protein
MGPNMNDTDDSLKQALLERKRHNSVGNSIPRKLNQSPLHYRKLKAEDGHHHCDGKSFFLYKEFPQKSAIDRKEVLDEIKQNLLCVTPAITPGQKHLSHADLVWDMAEMKKGSTSHGCHLKKLLARLNEHIQKSTRCETTFNSLRITYAHDKAVRMPLKAVNTAPLPVVALHIGRTRDLSITPKNFVPGVKATDLCDIALGNFSLIVLPHESAGQLHAYFSPEQEKPDSRGEQILLMPYMEETASSCSEVQEKSRMSHESLKTIDANATKYVQEGEMRMINNRQLIHNRAIETEMVEKPSKGDLETPAAQETGMDRKTTDSPEFKDCNTEQQPRGQELKTVGIPALRAKLALKLD